MDSKDDVNIEEMHYKDGHLQVVADHPSIAVLGTELARFFKEAGGVNYVAVTMHDKEDDKFYTVTVQPQGAQPMHEVNAGLISGIKSLLEGIEAVGEALNEDGTPPFSTGVALDALTERIDQLKAAYPVVTK